MEQYRAQTKVEEIQLTRGWNSHQYERFRNAIIREGKKLVYGDEYWRGKTKPEPVLWRNLPGAVIEEVRQNLRQQLKHDDLEAKTEIDLNILKWRLLPWLREEQRKIERRHDAEFRDANTLTPPANAQTQPLQRFAGSPYQRWGFPSPELPSGFGHAGAPLPPAYPARRPSTFFDPVADAIEKQQERVHL